MADITLRVEDHLARAGSVVRAAVARALQDVTDACLEEANRTIPLEEGILQDTGFTEVDKATLVGHVAYSTPYAVVQHEDATLHHDAGREDHWLEKTVDRNRTTYAERIAAEVRKAIG